MPTAQTAADVRRPGTSYYVPGVRILKLSEEMKKDGEKETAVPLPRDVLADILQVTVTRVSSGPSLYKLTLNNWYLSTATDRAHETDAFTKLGARETIDGQTGVWPRFKYNDFSLLKFGDRLRIDMRYMPEPVDDSAEREKKNQDPWVPMVSGPITDMRFSFGASEGARLEISGEDDLSMLQDKLCTDQRLDGRSEVTIVTDVLRSAGYPLKRIAAPLVPYPPFVTDKGQGLRESRQQGQSVLDLIQKLADRIDFEVFLEFAGLNDPDAENDSDSPLEFHFEPCRARALKTGFRLDRARDLLDFTPTIKLVDQYTEVRVEGRHRDPFLAEPVTGPALHDVVEDELHGSAPPSSAGAVRQHFFKKRVNCAKVPGQSNMDRVRARWYAEAVLRRKAREFFTIEATTLGRPRLRPGQHVEITGMRPPFDGFYYVTRTVTTYGGDGLRTKISARRPGMALPPYGAGQA
jgi:hypothetical protein